MPTIRTPSGRKVRFTSNFQYVWLYEDADYEGAIGRSNTLTTARVRAQEARSSRYGDTLVYDQGAFDAASRKRTHSAAPILIGRNRGGRWIALDGTDPVDDYTVCALCSTTLRFEDSYSPADEAICPPCDTEVTGRTHQ